MNIMKPYSYKVERNSVILFTKYIISEKEMKDFAKDIGLGFVNSTLINKRIPIGSYSRQRNRDYQFMHRYVDHRWNIPTYIKSDPWTKKVEKTDIDTAISQIKNTVNNFDTIMSLIEKLKTITGAEVTLRFK